MTPSATMLKSDDHDALPDGFQPYKKRKFDAMASEVVEDAEKGTLVKRHPLGVRPSGNALTSSANLKASCGPFALLPDELLMHFLEMLQIPHLLRLGSTCKALHAFTRSEELWRVLFLE